MKCQTEYKRDWLINFKICSILLKCCSRPMMQTKNRTSRIWLLHGLWFGCRSSCLPFNRSRKSYRGGVGFHEWSRGGKQWLAGAFTGENPSGKLFVMFSNQSINHNWVINLNTVKLFILIIINFLILAKYLHFKFAGIVSLF